MKVWIFQTGEPLHCDGENPRPMRAMNLANALVANGHIVEVFSSAFYHQEKRHRTSKFQSIHVHEQLTIHLIPSMGYKRNIGPGRLIDHAQMAVRLWRLLRSRRFGRPDLAFVGYPPIEVAWVMLRWLKKQDVPSVIDVKDQWPSLFIEAVPPALRPVAKVVFAPYFWLGRHAMRNATSISSMSEPFLAWALDFCGRPRQEADAVVPLVPARNPVTSTQMTDARITRYFMTIPEAAQLVIQAGAMASGGDVFVLDMGESVKIMDLARRMIELSGLTVQDEANPDGDIAIEVTGLRPGEKLYEELLIGDNPMPTQHPRIMKAHEEFLPWPELQAQLTELMQAVETNNVPAMRAQIQHLVPGYQPDGEVVDWVWLEQAKVS